LGEIAFVDSAPPSPPEWRENPTDPAECVKQCRHIGVRDEPSDDRETEKEAQKPHHAIDVAGACFDTPRVARLLSMTFGCFSHREERHPERDPGPGPGEQSKDASRLIGLRWAADRVTAAGGANALVPQSRGARSAQGQRCL
jgi:hypothetical protein